MNVIDRIADLSVLWKQASVIFLYFDKRDMDWDQIYRAFLPKVMGTEGGQGYARWDMS